MSRYSEKKQEIWRVVGSFVPHEVKVANRLGKDAFQWLDLRLKEIFNLYIRDLISDATAKYYIYLDIQKARRQGIGDLLTRLNTPDYTLAMLTTVGGIVELEDKQLAIFQRDKLMPDLEKIMLTGEDADWNKYADWLLNYWKKIKEQMMPLPWISGNIRIKKKEVKKLKEDKPEEIPVTEPLPEPLATRIKHNIGILIDAIFKLFRIFSRKKKKKEGTKK
ncbi:MAG: hypothetical protein J7L47_03180 [Candidatus Odinarchaeota archaeon]|nr:hypothetical protein [Candidatus Odinarchaeota archaeon]